MAAIGTVERHRFVPASQQNDAYKNRPLPIGYGQTISQPYIVALMTDLLEPRPDDVVLEIGTGSGYQAAILSRLVSEVYSIEIIPELGVSASQRLQRLGFDNVELKTGDGYYGWEEHAPFDAIIITAAASHIPPPLVRQLKPGGVLVIPVGPPFQVQHLTLVKKSRQGELRTRQILPVSFVPFTGKH
jgi:protein-L-isoaspartate(D-aspartate) O-methyltransferase